MAVPNSEAVQWLPSGSTSTESRSGRIGPIILEAKQTGERSAGNPHAAFDVASSELAVNQVDSMVQFLHSLDVRTRWTMNLTAFRDYPEQPF